MNLPSYLRLVFGVFFLCTSTSLLAQSSIHVSQTQEKIVLDGELNEPAWQSASKAASFWQYFPMDTIQAQSQTEIWMMYDEANLYVATKCYSTGENYIVPSLKRDYVFTGSDNLTLVIDTYNDKLNAFVFGINPYGVRREALIANGGRMREDFNTSWDNKWRAEAKVHGNYWTAEFAIPFKSIRYTEGSQKWRFNCYRNDTQVNEISSWIQRPRNYIIMDLGFMGDIIWDKPLSKPGANVSIIPYASVSSLRDFEDFSQTKSKFSGDFGGDAKIGITSGLNLDLTFNPDFSQVEVDEQVTNLDRFEIFFPERRQFFLENADLFNGFGLTRVNPFFSRRIGVALDTTTGLNVPNPIVYGARLSGKINENLRVGLINMQTAKLEESGLPPFNFSVAALQQKVFNRSNLSFIFVNKEAVGNEPNGAGDVYEPFNRVAGLEYRLASADNRWNGKTFYHHSFGQDQPEHPFTHGFQLEYLGKRSRFEWAHLFVGNGYNAEVGFVPRKDYMLLSPEIGFFIFPKSGVFNQHSINLDNRIFLQVGKDGNTIVPKWGFSEREMELSWMAQLKDFSQGSLIVTESQVTLLNDFDPTRLQDSGIFLAAGSKYHYLSAAAEYTSDARRKFTYEVSPTIGQFFNGFRAGIQGNLGFRYQPYGAVLFNFSYNYVKLDKPFVPAKIWLLGPRFDFTFTKSLFFTTFVQYNNQLDNLNINARFQWRFAPVSDFFIVYTDNYLTEDFSQFTGRNRALVAKVTYWLNL